MSEQKQYKCFHTFNGDGKNKGPILIIEVLKNPEGKDSGALIAHKWSGNGKATREEMVQVMEFYRMKEMNLISDYLEIIMT